MTDGNGCTDSLSFELIAPVAVTVELEMTPVNCFGTATGQVVATPAGGTPPYTYTWTNGDDTDTATGLLAGMVEVIMPSFPAWNQAQHAQGVDRKLGEVFTKLKKLFVV